MLGTAEILVIFFVILLLFGGKKLPELARSLGKGIREFKLATQGLIEEETLSPPKEAEFSQPESLASSDKRDEDNG